MPSVPLKHDYLSQPGRNEKRIAIEKQTKDGKSQQFKDKENVASKLGYDIKKAEDGYEPT